MLFPFTLSVVAKYFEKHPDVALVYSDTATMNENGTVYTYTANKDPGESLSNYGWRHFGAYRRTAYEQTEGYNRKLHCGCEDGDLFMQIAEKFKFGRIPMVLYMHRYHEKNASKTVNKCEVCPERPVNCNYIRVWAKEVGWDRVTWKPLEKKEEQGEQGETNG
jgi:hypothetical protein